MHFSFFKDIILYFKAGTFGAVMNFVCLTHADVRSEQWVFRGWATFAALAFHRSRRERSCSLAEADMYSREQLSCLSCQREAQPGNFMLPIPSPICCDTSVQPQSCPWHSLPAEAAFGSPSRVLHEF